MNTKQTIIFFVIMLSLGMAWIHYSNKETQYLMTCEVNHETRELYNCKDNNDTILDIDKPFNLNK